MTRAAVEAAVTAGAAAAATAAQTRQEFQLLDAAALRYAIRSTAPPPLHVVALHTPPHSPRHQFHRLASSAHHPRIARSYIRCSLWLSHAL